MKKIITLIMASMCLTSCLDNILDKQPLDIISDPLVWDDPTLTNAFLTDVYRQMTVLDNDANNTEAHTPLVINEVSDESRAIWHWYQEGGIKNSGLTLNGGLLDWWNTGYKLNRDLNLFIEHVTASGALTASFKKDKIAEARFLRAFNYFHLVKRFGGVPLITYVQAINEPEETLYPARDSEQKLYDFIISEMDAIGRDLPTPATPATAGRPTRWTALALKSRAALYAGSIAQFGKVQLDGILGFPAADAAKYYEISYRASDTIMRESSHSLYNADADKVTNFRNLFIKKDHAECIWVKKHDYSDRYNGGNGWIYDFLQCPKPHSFDCGNENGPYLEMVEEFEYIDGSSGKLDRTAIQKGLWTMEDLWKDKDPRFFATIYTNETSWKGSPIDWHSGLRLPNETVITSGSYSGVLAQGNQSIGGSFGTGFGVMKYLDESKDNMGNMFTSGTDWQIFRFGEILLNHAEAAFELGKGDEALRAVNRIRERAGIAALASIDREKIRHERKVELAFEGHRYWDVRRWRIATDVLTRNNSGLSYTLDFNTRKYILKVLDAIDQTSTHPLFFEYNYYFPLTRGRTNNNPKLKENPDYPR